MNSPLCAQVIVDTLVAHGVGHVVIAPGSRSAPLATTLTATDQLGKLMMHVRIDERDAGFLALGLAKARQELVAVVTTSGTAVGNLMPAVMEASHSGLPLMVISADRPATMIGSGANQTTDQVGIFGHFVRDAARISNEIGSPEDWAFQTGRLITTALGTLTNDPGPVQLNVSFEAPLVTTEQLPRDTVVAPSVQGPVAPAPTTLTPGPRTLVIAGDATVETGQRANAFASEARLPLIAEPSSNARFGDALQTGRLLLGGPLAEEIERVIVFGHPTLSRPVAKLLASDVELVLVTSSPRLPAWGRASWQIVPAVTWQGASDAAWFERWRSADRAAAFELAGLTSDELNGWQVAAAVQDSIGEQNLVLGSSNPIRDLDLAPVPVRACAAYANRGLAGIDGTIATAAGIALATGKPTTALMGDLTFLHDVGGMLTGPLERRPTLRVVVANDDGGSIFHTLEQGDDAYSDIFERVFATPTGVSLRPLAEAYGWAYAKPTSLEELRELLRDEPPVLELIEVPISRDDRRALTEEINKLGR